MIPDRQGPVEGGVGPGEAPLKAAAPTQRVLSTDCLLTSSAALIEELRGRAGAGERFVVDFTNTHIVALRHVDERFREVTSGVDCFVPDSQALYFAIRLLGGQIQGRVYGPDFLDQCVRACEGSSRHYFLGGSEGCLGRLLANLRERVPDVNIVGAHHGYLAEGDDVRIIEEINRLAPDFIWVGMGTPRQQEWIARNAPSISRGCLLAVGFAFDVNAGMKPDAPKWMQGLALTWLFRLGSEPGRLWGRYLKYNSIFLFCFARQLLKSCFVMR